MRLQNKTILVTGAASGIGVAIAEDCLREGAHVIGLDQAPCIKDIEHHPVDVADENAVRAVIGQIKKLDAAVNAAGIARRSSVDATDADEWDAVMQVNVRGTFLVSKHALPLLKVNGGSVLHIASIVGLTGVRNRSAYSASKGAVIALTRNMALDYAQWNVRVNCICPGFTKTPMLNGILGDEARLAAITKLHPLGKLGSPEDISKGAVFLLSDDASWITGQAIAIDGGMTAGFSDDI